MHAHLGAGPRHRIADRRDRPGACRQRVIEQIDGLGAETFGKLLKFGQLADAVQTRGVLSKLCGAASWSPVGAAGVTTPGAGLVRTVSGGEAGERLEKLSDSLT